MGIRFWLKGVLRTGRIMRGIRSHIMCDDPWTGRIKWGLVILSGLFLFGYSEARAEDWKLFSRSEGSSFFYDAEGVSCPSENLFRVWVKVVVSEQDRSSWVERGGQKYLNLSYIKSLMEINCKDKTERSLSLELFSERETLASFKGEPRWNSIPPGSNWDHLQKAICK
jgi:hypothetical protein